ncbi:MAG: type II toxin-antitoxin system Phd/YefM family antitoxin [Geminicoccaceae bacterium]|nr:type II toxin-antitoxin system Phd/YefM family antitoxin [Geminicoccaceae bacterium]
MTTVTAREANQHFARILKQAEAGEEVVITRRGKPVVKLVAVGETEEEAAKKAREREEALEFFRKGIKGGPVKPWTREELYMERFKKLYEERFERPYPDDR